MLTWQDLAHALRLWVVDAVTQDPLAPGEKCRTALLEQEVLNVADTGQSAGYGDFVGPGLGDWLGLGDGLGLWVRGGAEWVLCGADGLVLRTVGAGRAVPTWTASGA